MKFYRLTAALSAAVMLFATPISLISASAAVTDDQKKEITDVLFESAWESGLDVDYWQLTRSTVPIEDNPLASITYFSIEAEVAVCNNTLLEDLYNGNIGIKQFYEDIDYDYTKAKKIEKYKNSLLAGEEFCIVDYNNGSWEIETLIDSETLYCYFREDSENFKLYDNDTNELLGTYPRQLGYEYLNDDDAGGNGGGGAGGSGGSGGSGSSNDTENVSESDSSSSSEKAESNKTSSFKENHSSVSVDENAEYGDHISRYDTDNPAVTPEIASTVDELKKDSAQSLNTSHPKKPKEKSSTPLVLVIVTVIIAAGAAFFINQKKKNGSTPQK